MRNLKRALSLLLSSAMVLGMMVMGSSAASYTDVTSKENVEAIEVLKAVGVMTGDQNGKFNPGKAVTRNEMAVVMANLLNLDYEYYTGAKTSFTDVPEWAAKYVAACQANGIIAGYSNTIFGGNDNVTAAQAALMMMKALGYFKYQGDFENDWQLATVKQASKIDLYDGINAGATAPLTRNDVAQLVLNTLEADMVEFNGTVGTDITTSDGTTITVGYRAQYDPYAAPSGANYNNATPSTSHDAVYRQLAEELFGNDLQKSTSSISDEFERPSTTWTYNKNGVVKNIGTFANDATLTYTEAVELGTIYTELGLSANKAAANVTFHVDGAAEASPYTGYTISKGDKTEIGGNGVLTQVYVDDTTNDVTVTMTNTYAGEVTSVRAATSTKDANITVTPLNATRGGNFETEDFKVDDIVYYTYSNKASDVGVQSVVKAEQITGELTGYTAGKSVVVGGTTYKFNAAAVISTSELAGAINSDVTLTLDQYGYVLDVDVSAASTNYAVVLGYADGNGIDNARAKLLFTDGTTKTVNLSGNVDKLAGGDLTEGDIVSYTINNKDQYVLTTLADADSFATGGTVVTKGTATITDMGSRITAVNGKTIFLVATKNGNDTVYTSYTGIANVPTINLSATSTGVGVYAKNGSVATVVYINATKSGSSVSSSSDNVVFVLGDSSVGASYDSVKGTYYVYDAIVNGEITKIESATQHTAFGMYNTISTDTNGVVTVSNTAGITGNGTTIKGTGKEENGSITLNNTVLSYADDCQVFYIDTDKNISVSSIGGIANDETDKVWYKVVDNEVVAVVIYQVVSNDRTITGATCEFTGANITNVTATYSAPTFSVTVSGRASNGDTIVLKPTVSAGAVANSITLTYNGTAWVADTLDVVATSESGLSTTTTVTISGITMAP